MTIANTLITMALREINVTPSGEDSDSNDSLEARDIANMMLDQWSTEDLMLYYDKVDSIPLVAGQISYEVGPTGADATIVRPIEVISANVRDSANFDRFVNVIPHTNYQQIAQKTATGNTYPTDMCYIPTFPDATILVYPVPAADLTLRILSNYLFTNIANLSDDVPLPLGYKACFVYGLAELLCTKYGRTKLIPAMAEKARRAKMIVKRKNSKKTILRLDPSFLPRRGGSYNPNTDQ